jgi:hypothetical protein
MVGIVVSCTCVRRGAIAICIENDLGTLQGWPQRREISGGPQAVGGGLRPGARDLSHIQPSLHLA